MMNQSENTNINLSSPTVDEWDAIFNYMIVNNLSSYSDRDDCVDDEPSTLVSCLSQDAEEDQEQEEEQEEEQEKEQEQEKEWQEQEPAVQVVYDRIAREAAEFIDRQETDTLTEIDKEWIWNYGSEEEKAQLGDWQPPAKSNVVVSEKAKRGVEAYMRLEKEIKDRNDRFDRGEETPADIMWRHEMGLSKI